MLCVSYTWGHTGTYLQRGVFMYTVIRPVEKWRVQFLGLFFNLMDWFRDWFNSIKDAGHCLVKNYSISQATWFVCVCVCVCACMWAHMCVTRQMSVQVCWVLDELWWESYSASESLSWHIWRAGTAGLLRPGVWGNTWLMWEVWWSWSEILGGHFSICSNQGSVETLTCLLEFMCL